MNQKDYRMVDVTKGAEKKVCEIFDLFGYKLFSLQEVSFDPFSKAAETKDLYDEKSVYEAFCGFHLPDHSVDASLKSYVKITFIRERLNSFFPYFLREEQNFLRLAFDSSFLDDQIVSEKKKSYVPGILLAVYVVFAFLGGILFALGIAQGGSTGGEVFKDVSHAEYYFGIIFLVAGLACLLFDTLVRKIVHYERSEALKRDKETVDGVIEKLLSDMKATDVYPHIRFDAVAEIEKKRRIYGISEKEGGASAS